MINKIIIKIKKYGIKKSLYKINHKIFENFESYFNILNKEKNYILKEKLKYWTCFNYIKRKYLKDIIRIKKIKGTNEFSNKVWWCWLQGEENAPEIQKICLDSLRKRLTDREIIIITKNNLFEYISFPKYIIDKYNKGYISNTHFSDLIRLELLINYGGTWIDSSVLCTNYDKKLFNKKLFVYKNYNNIWFANRSKFNQEPMIADNWFITSEIRNPILIAVRDMLLKYWKKHNSTVDYFIFQYFFTLIVEYKYKEEFEEIETIPHIIPHLLQNSYLDKYDENKFNDILKSSSFHKITNKVENELIKKDSFYYLLINKQIKV